MILFTVPGIVALGWSGIRAVSSLSSAILADLAMRGLAISSLTWECKILLDTFPRRLRRMGPS